MSAAIALLIRFGQAESILISKRFCFNPGANWRLMSGRWVGGGGGAGPEAGASVPPPAARPVRWRGTGLLTAHLARAPTSHLGARGSGAGGTVLHKPLTLFHMFLTILYALFLIVCSSRYCYWDGINLLNKYDPAQRSQFCASLNKNHPLVLCRAVIKV